MSGNNNEQIIELKERLDKLEEKNGQLKPVPPAPSSFSASSSSQRIFESSFINKSGNRQRRRTIKKPFEYIGSKDTDGPLYEHINDDPKFLEISQSKFAFARNAHGVEYGRLLVQQTDNPDEVVEYGRTPNKNTCYCVKCRKNGFFVFFAPTEHNHNCVISKNDAEKQQQKFDPNFSFDFLPFNIQGEGNGQQQQEQGISEPPQKRMRMNETEFKNVKIFASAGTQTDCTKVEDTENEFKCTFDVHAFEKNEIKATLEEDGQMLVITREQHKNGQGNVTEKHCTQVILPNTIQKDKLQKEFGDGLLVISFPKKVKSRSIVVIDLEI